ncbi:PLP-dependent aminotransferase family protein [Rhizobium calliandrae]|uniref:PLP-dependent aminotransferase family protein n=1 Tax=Rhizobium calliandrae TaxID=1312182 RepID=A0ABT7KQ14_9HYPH|nr:PLP-dependent aminotransferase family protein [Rhizobium calliandrae]MDL2410714.1 PLP-dependent aminotransferase family protein [Rhizobium calliandrae]
MNPINMSGNLPPLVPHIFDDIYRAAIAQVLDDGSPNSLIGAHQFCGSERDRTAGARFAGLRLPQVPPADRVVVANGTQSILSMLLHSLVGKGGCLAIEALSYPTMHQFADMFGFRLSAVPMDHEGIEPEAFEAICHKDAPSAYYALPTLQNPTTAIMSVERRQAIAEICRRYGVAIIEDDIYSLLPHDIPPPLSSFAPELSWYILGTAKSMVAALKVAYLVAPNAEDIPKLFWPGVRATYWMCAPINAAVASRLIEGDGATRIIDAVRTETRERHALVAARFTGADLRSMPECLHVWLNLPEQRPADKFVAMVSSLGVNISPSATYAFGNGTPPNAIRFGTGTARDRATFERGLNAIIQAYHS